MVALGLQWADLRSEFLNTQTLTCIYSVVILMDVVVVDEENTRYSISDSYVYYSVADTDSNERKREGKIRKRNRKRHC